MKCPKCGYVSFPGLPQCKKCGQPFLRPAGRPSPSIFGPINPPAAVSPRPAPPEKTAENPLASAPDIDETPILPSEPATTPANAWRDELSKRVEGFRRRRAQVHGDDASGTLNFDFDAQESAPEASKPRVIDFPVSSPPPLPPLEEEYSEDEVGSELQPPGSGEAGIPDEGSPGTLGEIRLDNRAEESPLEIVLESSPPQEPADQAAARGAATFNVAKVGGRFVAGILDGLILSLGAGVFTLIFWRAGGRLSRQPLDLAIVLFIACFFALLYFGAFTAFTSSTPGLIQMGLEIRTDSGHEPSVRDAFWRALGWLISAGALMLGFLWALVDSDGLTWHDRMSGTFITPSRRSRAAARPGEARI